VFFFGEPPRAEARVGSPPYTMSQACENNAIELIRRKSNQIAKVQPATIAKPAFSTFVITSFMSLPPNCPFFPVPALSPVLTVRYDLQVAYVGLACQSYSLSYCLKHETCQQISTDIKTI